MIAKELLVLVGDASGADKAVQQHFAARAYQNVIVHCMAGGCRNNVGGWEIREFEAPRAAKGFDYYSVKDRAMATAADYGLMLWDGKSKGTINDVVNLSRDGKPVVVYVAPKKRFVTVRGFGDLRGLLDQGEAESVGRVVRALHLDDLQTRLAG